MSEQQDDPRIIKARDILSDYAARAGRGGGNAEGTLVSVALVLGATPTRIGKAPLVGYGWGWRDGEWWTVVYRDGEPDVAFHHRHGCIGANRDTFTHWSASAVPPEVP